MIDWARETRLCLKSDCSCVTIDRIFELGEHRRAHGLVAQIAVAHISTGGQPAQLVHGEPVQCRRALLNRGEPPTVNLAAGQRDAQDTG